MKQKSQLVKVGHFLNSQPNSEPFPCEESIFQLDNFCQNKWPSGQVKLVKEGPEFDFPFNSLQERSAPKTGSTVMTKMLRRFSIDSGGANKANKPSLGAVEDNV